MKKEPVFELLSVFSPVSKRQLPRQCVGHVSQAYSINWLQWKTNGRLPTSLCVFMYSHSLYTTISVTFLVNDWEQHCVCLPGETVWNSLYALIPIFKQYCILPISRQLAFSRASSVAELLLLTFFSITL